MTKHRAGHLLLVSFVTLKSLLTQFQVPCMLNGDNIFVKTKENTTHKAGSPAPARHIILVVQSLSHVRLFVTPWTAVCQDSCVLHHLP